MNIIIKHGESEGFDSCERPSDLTEIGFISWIFQPVWPSKLMNDLEKLQGTSFTLHQASCIITNPSVNSNRNYCPETLNLGQIRRLFYPSGLEIWWMTSKNNRAPLLCYIKLCASFQSHRWSNELQYGNAQFGLNSAFLSRMTLKFDGWPWKTIGHLFNATSRFVHHFVAIGEFKLEVQSGNAHFR